MNELETLNEMNALGITFGILGVGVVIVALVVFSKWRKRRNKAGVILETVNGDKPKKTSGNVTFPAYLLNGGMLIETHIKEPIGSVFMADSSMPVSGSVYLVQMEKGKMVPYDPRQEPFKSEETPEWAYFSTHWEDAQAVWGKITPWWQSAPTWVTVGVIVLVFMAMLIFVG